MKNEPPLIQALTLHYDKVGILSTNFRCPHLDKCRREMPVTPQDARDATGTFTPAKSAYVGEHYGDGAPRLLFVSSDPGGAIYDSEHYNLASDESRTPESVRRIETIGVEKLGLGPPGHWRYTHEMTRTIHAKFGLRLPNAEEALPHFANINAAKCCMNKEGKEEANARLFNKCRDYLREEINVLAPDIVVTQGAWAKEGVAHAFSIPSEWGCESEIQLDDGKRALWFPIYHPSNYGAFHKQRNGEKWGPDWKKFAERVREFISARDSLPGFGPASAL